MNSLLLLQRGDVRRAAVGSAQMAQAEMSGPFFLALDKCKRFCAASRPTRTACLQGASLTILLRLRQSSAPVVAPDGSILYGSYTRYNYAEGHLLRFSSTGQFLNSYIFGWDDTPAIRVHGNTYSIITKDNHYGGVGSYCGVEAVCPSDRTASNPGYPEAYFVTSLSPNLSVEWSFQNTNTLSCTRNP